MRRSWLVLWLVATAASCGLVDAFEPVNKPAPRLDLATLDGRPVDLRKEYAGRPLVVHFWLPFCGVCAREVPDVMAAYKEAQELGVGFVAVSIDPAVEAVRERSAKLGMTVPLLVARDEALGPMYAGGTPSTVFIDREGIIRAAVTGPRDAPFYSRRLRDITR